jgi:hypothetical protein
MPILSLSFFSLLGVPGRHQTLDRHLLNEQKKRTNMPTLLWVRRATSLEKDSAVPGSDCAALCCKAFQAGLHQLLASIQTAATSVPG